MGSNSNRYRATGRESQHYDTVKAFAEIFRITMKDARFFSEIQPNFSRIITKRFRSRFLGPFLGRGSVDMCKKTTHGFIVSTKSRPNLAENQISNFYIFPKWGEIGPDPRPFLSDPQGSNVEVSIKWCGPPKGAYGSHIGQKCPSEGL